jgi:hypothetical protein
MADQLISHSHGALAEFRRHWHDPDALRRLVAKCIRLDPERVARESRETTTHFKWLVATDGMLGGKVWLHEYKLGYERRPGYASTVHNHRYPFTAVALNGGYTNKLYRVAFERSSLRVVTCDIVDSERLVEGSTYSMQPEEYHCVDDIEDGTQTLIVEHPPERTVSFSLDQRRERMTEHVPLEVRVRNLLQMAFLTGSRTTSSPV